MTDHTPKPWWPPHATRRHVQEPAPDAAPAEPTTWPEGLMTYQQVRDVVRREFEHDIEHLGSKVERLRTRAFEAEARENFLRTRAERAESNARGKQAVIEAKRATLDRVRTLADEWESNENWRAWGIGSRLRAILDAPQPEAGGDDE